MKSMNVAILLGGRSEEREISLLTGRSVATALQKKGCNIELIDWQGRESVADLLKQKYDCAFIALHGLDGEDGCVQSVLEVLEIPYTGSGVLANALCIDKVKTKKVLKQYDLPILNDHVIDENTDLEALIAELGLPLCVKPSKQGSSVGIYKVKNANDLKEAITDAKNFGDAIMVEPWLEGGEYTVGILNNKPLPSIRIEAAQEFYNYDAKYLTGDTNYYCPSGLNNQQEEQIQKLACKAFNATDCYDWARVDFVTNNNGDFFILEINTVPGLTQTSLLPKAAAKLGINFDDMIYEITKRASLKRDNPSRGENSLNNNGKELA